MESLSSQQPFQVLCANAARSRWCWNIFCTTCGAIEFRGALWQLAVGRPAPAGRLLLRCWPLVVQRAVIREVVSAAVEQIVNDAPFPDGLGYLGLTLSVTVDAEAQDGRLTQSWVPRLRTFLWGRIDTVDQVAPPWFMTGGVLQWRDMEPLESAIRQTRRL